MRCVYVLAAMAAGDPDETRPRVVWRAQTGMGSPMVVTIVASHFLDPASGRERARSANRWLCCVAAQASVMGLRIVGAMRLARFSMVKRRVSQPPISRYLEMSTTPRLVPAETLLICNQPSRLYPQVERMFLILLVVLSFLHQVLRYLHMTGHVQIQIRRETLCMGQ